MLLLAIGGVPQAVFDKVVAETSRGDSTVVYVGSAIRPGDQARYWDDTRYADTLLGKIKDTFRRNAGFVEGCAIALVVPPNVNARLPQYVEPYVPCFQIQAAQPVDNRTQIAQFKNRVANDIRGVVRRLKATTPTIRHEISSGANKTPFLLPPVSFQSRSLREHLRSVATALVASGNDMQQVLREVGAAIARDHPLQALGNNHQRYFVDDRGVYFVPPGRDRHGLVRENAGDTARCEVGAHFRFGARYAPEFHYDCQRPGRWTHGYANCHGQGHAHDGSHINIAPNERARG